MSTDLTEEKREISRYRFHDFILDAADRQLWQGTSRIDLKSRYLDALLLLVKEADQLVEKDRFFSDVWRDVIVSDSALTQCIKEIRKQLGDDASNPRFIQTVPRHGYRFIANVELLQGAEAGKQLSSDTAVEHSRLPHEPGSWTQTARTGLLDWGAGTLGGVAAGLFGGMLYGFGLASADDGSGTLSTLLVIVVVNVLVGLMGAFGISFGLAGAGVLSRNVPQMHVATKVVGAGAGGFIVGSTSKLLGIDAFNLLFGSAPAGITGGGEGAALGAALVVGAYMGHWIGVRQRKETVWHSVVGGGIGCAVVGALIPLAGGNLMGGSLALLGQSFEESRLQLDSLGRLFGEHDFGITTQVVLGSIEGMLFGCCVVGAIVFARRWRRDSRDVSSL